MCTALSRDSGSKGRAIEAPSLFFLAFEPYILYSFVNIYSVIVIFFQSFRECSCFCHFSPQSTQAVSIRLPHSDYFSFKISACCRFMAFTVLRINSYCSPQCNKFLTAVIDTLCVLFKSVTMTANREV
jgi:hypothetical protein